MTYRHPSGQVWAFDSEFLMSGRTEHPEDVMSVQFSDGSLDNSVVLETSDALKSWFHSHEHVATLYAFVLLPDAASIGEWVGSNHIRYRMRGSQLLAKLDFRGFHATLFDSRPLLQSFGVRRLSDAGDIVGVPKLSKPSWLGLRKWRDNREHEEFRNYAVADAIITSRIVSWLRANFHADPRDHASSGTLARDVFVLPKRLKRIKNTIVLPPLERAVKSVCFAGRNEGFVIGFTPNVVYNDAKNLYGCDLAVTHALEIVDAEPCDFKDLSVNSDTALDDMRFGWIEGVFESHNDLWAIPLRGRNNFYATGVVSGFFHTFDLIAAKASVLSVAHCYRPKFNRSKAHARACCMLLDYLENRTKSEIEAIYNKSLLRSISGKLGQSHPVSGTSNFFAYSTVLAHSHAIMSRLFDKCPNSILAMDTDSIFSQSDMSGRWFELSEGEYSIPIILDAKGKGDLSFFRAKNYILKGDDGYVYGRHGWMYFLEDFLSLADGSVTELQTRQDIKHTLLTRQREAQVMAKGRWFTKPITLTLDDIKRLLQADLKRKRENYDSYGLVMEKKNCLSRAWNYEELMRMRSENPLDFPTMIAR
jgi:hypothetical protein